MMRIEEVHMTASDLIVILRVLEKSQGDIATIDFGEVVNKLGQNDVISSDRRHFLYQKFNKERCASETQFHAFISEVNGYVPFFGFIEALKDAGYCWLSDEILIERDKSYYLCRGMIRRELPNAKLILSYYMQLKRCCDNNVFINQADGVLKNMIVAMETESGICQDLNRQQLLVDKKCILYFILIQQCSRIPERNKILMRMRNTMPRDVDRTVFDTVFHSCMSFNRAISGDAQTAESHEKQARIACDSCAGGFVKIVLSLWSQYKNNILYLQSNCNSGDYLDQAKIDFDQVQQCIAEITEDEQNLWRIISVLDMVRATVGIHSKFQTLEVCDINSIEERNIQYAKHMLDEVPFPADMRRRMYYLVLKGRVNERYNRPLAVDCVKEAYSLANDGCYEVSEKNNISEYLNRLMTFELPRPSIYR